ncbi:short-subunit dehydrogenase [Shimia isoporae]|uniref:Short-subunit dehydrogenase n=1 Tax=Shimia isoporae TaxID=647720 RepID=A0A4R1N0Z4_9RHOB|nr:SDR family NAD(P)-dependent oxidoreductase [Shimia isoporae]TCK99758.1 short-subunit dehydrogenase [Shimia isoporae]
MRGKTCVVTGATSGIGEQTAYALASLGADLILVCRNRDKGRRVTERIRLATGEDRARLIVGDLADLAQVRMIAAAVRALDCPVHVLVNNAGVFNLSRRLTVDGHEEMFAVNHLAHFLLTTELLDLLQEAGGARVVTLGSGAHMLVKSINFSDVTFEDGFSALKVYSHSKLANCLFGHTLAYRLQGTGVTSNVVDPGEVSTNLGTQNGWIGWGLKHVLSLTLQNPVKGARTSIYACASHDLDGVSGVYLRNSKITNPRAWAVDDVMGKKLWEHSEELI